MSGEKNETAEFGNCASRDNKHLFGRFYELLLLMNEWMDAVVVCCCQLKNNNERQVEFRS